MEGIQNDQKILNEGRKGRLEDVDAPLRDQIDKKLLRKLREDKFADKIVEIWHQANSERSERLARRQIYLNDWDQFTENQAQDEAYAGTSNLHIPVTFTVLKTYHARILQALLANFPLPKARRPDSVDREKVVAEVMEYAVKDWANQYEGIESVLDSWVWEWAGYGSGTLKGRWETKFEKFVDVVTVPEITYETVVDEQGNERQVPRLSQKEVEEERVITTCDGPVADFIPEEDFVMVGGEGNPQKADIVYHRQHLDASEMWTFVDRKIFEEDAVKRAIKGGDNPKASSLAGDIKLQKYQASGENSPDTTADLARYEWLEVYTSYDVDGDGINSEIVAWIHPDTREIGKATYLRRMNRTGKRPFFTAEFHRRPGAPHPIGLIEILHPLAKEMDALHNMRIDAGIFSTMPFGFYRASSSLNPQAIKYEPGSLIPLDDPTRDVYFPNLGNRTSFGLQEEAGIQNMIERLTGISDLTLGAMSGNQGPARTATGVRGLIGEANANLDVHLKRLFRAYKQYLKHLLGLLQQRIPPGLSFKVTGDDGQNYWRWVASQDDIAGDFDFEIDPSSADSNPQVRKEKAMQVFNMIMNPLLIQIGVVTPTNVFEAAKALLLSDDIKTWSRFIQQPPTDQVIMTPQEEVNRLLHGISVPVTMNGDHEGFLAYFEFIMSQPEILGRFGQEEVTEMAKQAQKHKQMLQAIQQMQAQQANVAQMRMNAAQSSNQTAPGMAPGVSTQSGIPAA